MDVPSTLLVWLYTHSVVDAKWSLKLGIYLYISLYGPLATGDTRYTLLKQSCTCIL